VKATEISIFKELDFSQIIKANEIEKRPSISIKTVNGGDKMCQKAA
jgi:hypothetical protein